MVSANDPNRMMFLTSVPGYDPANHRLVALRIGNNTIDRAMLTHEFTHALHWADQEAHGQDHPIWIAEGFATLSETSNIDSGHLVPLPNPRLVPLKHAIEHNKMIPLRQFIKFDQGQYMRQADLCYGEGRYLMMYLYSKGLLRKWYDAYVDSFKDDPTGGKAMEAVLGNNLDQIEKDFVAYVKALESVSTWPGKDVGVNTAPTAPAGAAAASGKQEAPPAQPTEKKRAVLGLALDDTAVVQSVAPNSGEAKAGLKLGDAIVRLDGQPIKVS